MRKPIPITLELSIPDERFLSEWSNALLLEVVRRTLENSSATYAEKLAYIDNIIRALKSG